MKARIFLLVILVFLILLLWLAVRFFLGANLDAVHAVFLGIALVLFSLVWLLAARKGSRALWITAGLLLLLLLSTPFSAFMVLTPASDAEPFSSSLAFTLFLIPAAAILAAALLIHSGLRRLRSPGSAASAAVGAAVLRSPSLGDACLVLAVVLLVKALHNVYWLTVWDNTTDPLGYIWLVIPIFAAIFSGGLLAIILSEGQKVTALGYTLLVSAALVMVSGQAQRVDFHKLTQARAEQVSQAVERFHARTGRYPDDLGQLIPRNLPWLPEPVVIFGQDWCYDGSVSGYRLGYVDREHWSDPRLIGRLHAAKGESPSLQPVCAAQIGALQTAYPEYPYTYWRKAQ